MSQADFSRARANMVDGQLRPNRITDKALLAAFAAVPRELFVPPAQRGVAYADETVLLGQGREMMAPLTLAHLLQGLGLAENSHVLVVAAATGYSAAVAALVAGKVVMVEDNKRYLTAAKNTLLDLNIANVRTLHAAPEAGAPRHAPFDAVLLDAPAAVIPAALIAQLKDGGKLAAVRVGADGVPEATIYTKHGKTLFDETLFETHGHVLANFQQAEGFVF
ncbi:MAG: protein-L-isoaspartate O-methyltransferase [Pseudomonadaceae bacterium]|nr:protein-L-isoaspartate O-methyltransferase [Pseudomonadaceae bacterium]